MPYVYEELLGALEEANKKESDVEWFSLKLEPQDTRSDIEFKGESKDFNKIKDMFPEEYSSGFGLQELYGYVVFKDNTWLERGEYDGSEWWEYKYPPKRDF